MGFVGKLEEIPARARQQIEGGAGHKEHGRRRLGDKERRRHGRRDAALSNSAIA